MADKLTTEELLENQEYVDTLFDYAKRQGKRLATREDALENFLGDYRGVQANTALAFMFSNDVENIRDDEERKKLGQLYKAVDEDLENFAGEQTALQTVTEYGVKGVLDPLNIFGLGIGKVVASTVGRAGIKKLISDAFKKKAVTSPIIQGAKAGALTEGGIGLTQGFLLEDIKGEDALDYQDEINYGNVALQGIVGGLSGGVLGAAGAKLGKSATKNVESIEKAAEEAKLAKSTQHKVAQSKDVESFLTKTNPDTNKNYVETDVIGTYVESPTKGVNLLTDNAENYGTYGRIMDVEKGQATVEFIPTKYSKERNPATDKFDERIQITVPVSELKATSLKNKDEYLKQFVEEYGLFFDKAGIESGKQLLRNSKRVSSSEIEEIFTNTLSQDAYEDVTRFVFDAGQDIQRNMPNSKLAKQVEVVLDDPTKRVTEKVATLLQLGSKNKELLSESINKALASSGRSIDELVNILKADLSVSASKMATQSDIQKLLDPTSEINKKLNKMLANQTDSQRKMLSALADERQLEKQMAKKFGVSVDLWRSFLVTQPATTLRNIIGSTLRVPGETLNTLIDRFMVQLEADALGVTAPTFVPQKDLSLLAKNLLSPYESVQMAQMVSKSFPEAERQLFKLFDDYFSSTLSEKTGAGNVLKSINYISQKANVLNRMQDRSIKSAGFMTELDYQIKNAIRRGEITDPEVKGIEDVLRQDKMNLLNDTMVSKALEFAYKLTYQTRNAGDDLIIGGKMINNLQNAANRLAIVKLGIPFPNFIFNGIVYNLNRLGFGAAKALVSKGKVLKFDKADILKETRFVTAYKTRINRLRNLSAKQIKDINKKEGRNFVTEEIKRLTNQIDELDAKAGTRLKDVENYRKGIVETIEGVSFVGVAYGIREMYGGSRYDEIKVGNSSFNVGPLFPLTPYLWIAEAIRKRLDDEPFDATFIGEGIEALTGFQTDRAGPISKFVGNLRKTLDTISNSDDPNTYKKIGEEFGAFAGYIAKGYLTPLKAFDDLVKTVGSKELRLSYDKNFQNVISEESDSLGVEAIRGAFNEFSRQMIRGTSAQGLLGGSEEDTISVTGEEQKIQSAPFIKQMTGVGNVPPRDSVGDELERLGIPSWKLAKRSSVPEYTRLYKILLGQESEKYTKRWINSEIYKNLSFQDQLDSVRNIYYGDKGDMSPTLQEALRSFGPLYNNVREKVSSKIKNDKKYQFLDQLHKFRTRNSKAEISRALKEKPGTMTNPIKYYGDNTADNRSVAKARLQARELLELQTIIDSFGRGMAGYINKAKGGYVSQMNALGFDEGGYVGGDEMGLATSGRDRIEDRPESVRVPSTQALDITGDGKVNHVDLVEALRPTAPQEYKEMAENIASLIDKKEFAKAAGLTAMMGASVVPLGRSATAPARRSITRELNEMPDSIDTSVVKSNIAPEGLSSTPNKISADEVVADDATKTYAKSIEDADRFDNVEDWQAEVKVIKKSNNVDLSVRTPELEASAKRLINKEIPREEHLRSIDKHKPVRGFDELPRQPTDKAVVFALNNSQREKGLFQLPEEVTKKLNVKRSPLKVGDPVQGRLDIPAYLDHDTWIVTLLSPQIKNAKGNRTSIYGKAIHYAPDSKKGHVEFKAAEGLGQKIATGHNKTPYATVMGTVKDLDSERIRKKASGLLNDPEWVQLSFDPRRQTSFYVRKGADGLPVHTPIASADEVIQIGPLVLAKNAVAKTKKDGTPWTDLNRGGSINRQMVALGL